MRPERTGEAICSAPRWIRSSMSWCSLEIDWEWIDREVAPLYSETGFEHEVPHERSDLSNWRKRLASKLELLLAESFRVARESKYELGEVDAKVVLTLRSVPLPSYTRRRELPWHRRQR